MRRTWSTAGTHTGVAIGAWARACRVGQRRGVLPRIIRATGVAAVGLALAASGAAAQTSARPATGSATPNRGGPEWASTQQVLGGKGAMQPGDVLKFSFPRTDLHVTADGVALKPGFALGSWIAFKRMGTGTSAMAMGDLVLTEDEVEPVMLALPAGRRRADRAPQPRAA